MKLCILENLTALAMKLYWVTTKDCLEDWFVVAKTKQAASRYHELAEGFNSGDANAEFICNVDEELCNFDNSNKKGSFWPSLTLLKTIGGKIISAKNPRAVNIKGKVFIEGGSVETIVLNDALKSCGLYVIKIQGTRKHKIGITKNIRKRLKEFATGNPYNLKLLFFISTNHFKSLEKFLHNEYKEYRLKGEWFSFDSKVIKKLEGHLQFLCSQSADFKFHDIKSILILGRVY
jgi:hypothetical protein